MATTIWQFGLAYGVLGGLGLAATRQVVAATLVGNWFVFRRGLVQGVVGQPERWARCWSSPSICSLSGIMAGKHVPRYGYRAVGRRAALHLGHSSAIAPRTSACTLRGHVTKQAQTTRGNRLVEGIPFRQALAQPQTWVLVYLGFA